MNPDFVVYKKLADLETAHTIIGLLQKEGIECHLQDDQHQYVKVVGYQQIEYGVSINLKSADFAVADKVMEAYYATGIEAIDKDYYLFAFSNEELMDVVNHPYDWGILDLQLAKKLLKARGIDITEEFILSRKNDRLQQLSAIVPVPFYKRALGYFFAVLIPLLGVIMGLLILHNRNLLPTGEKVYIHSTADRNHGRAMIAVSILFGFLYVFRIF